MNWNIINKPCTEWSKNDWREAYAQYCKTNMFGPMTKQQYYDFVCRRNARLYQKQPEYTKEQIHKWHLGKIAALKWARSRNCDINGRDLDIIRAEQRDSNISQLEEDILDLQQKMYYYHENKSL
ncbi:MAG: hypothetical protein MJ156_00290 [Alphaproteobacteria bacterium]|nr:hypothetical protein [Alphaproteobacteria bacterium]